MYIVAFIKPFMICRLTKISEIFIWHIICETAWSGKWEQYLWEQSQGERRRIIIQYFRASHLGL